jgi:hypothetical protein
MRKTGSSGGLTALAVAGGYVVVLGWDMSKQDIDAKTVLGFAVRRMRASDGEVIWLGGMKTFHSVEPNPDPGVLVSSYRHPLQTFQWSDYSVAPGESYTYDVVARGGPPGALMDVAAVSLAVTTERVDLGTPSSSTAARSRHRSMRAVSRTGSRAKWGRRPMTGSRAA